MTFLAYFSLQSTKSQPCGHDGFVLHKRHIFLAVLSHFHAQPTKSQPHGHDGFVPHKRCGMLTFSVQSLKSQPCGHDRIVPHQRHIFLAALSHFTFHYCCHHICLTYVLQKSHNSTTLRRDETTAH